MTPQTMKQVRRFHLYLGMFFTPAILLFALSGALQTFRLQEEKGYGGTPPDWIVWIASVHKDQRLPRAETERKLPPPVAARAEPTRAAAKPAAKKDSTLPLKTFVGLMSIGLMLSALLGMVIALNSRATRKISLAMLATGVFVPLLFLFV